MIALLAAVALAQGFAAGPAKAPTTLVEYGSLHCPHCAHFSKEASGEINKRVKAGTLRFEFRPFLLFPQDIPATLIARCVPAPRRLGFVEEYYRNSAAVTGRLRASADQINAVRDQGVAALNRKIADVGQMKPIAARFGLTPAAADRCLADPANLAWLEAQQKAGTAAGITGTPTFELNGQRMRFASPEELKAALAR